MDSVKITYDSITDIGKRKNNEDRFLSICKEINKRTFAVFAVADGVGGRPRGENASTIVMNEVKLWAKKMFYQIEDDDVDPLKELRRLIKCANTHVFNYGKKNGIHPGSTLTMLLFYDSAIYLAHVGDSVAYQIENGFSYKISDDHIGYNGKKKGLTSCIGTREKVNVVQTRKLKANLPTIFFIGSDGIFNTLQINRYIEPLMNEKKGVLSEIVKNIRANGETDNATGIIIRLSKNEQ